MNNANINPLDFRKPEYLVDSLFVRRWSPRAMSGEGLEHERLLGLFEAARWAPSSGNKQEWYFLYAHRDTEQFRLFWSFLNEGNQAWCDKSAVLVVILSRKMRDDGKLNRTHAFDTGMAFQNLALQATIEGLVSHPMAGYDAMRVRAELKIPEKFDIQAMLAIGHPGNIEDLPEYQQKREVPSGRKTVIEFIQEGGFELEL